MTSGERGMEIYFISQNSRLGVCIAGKFDAFAAECPMSIYGSVSTELQLLVVIPTSTIQRLKIICVIKGRTNDCKFSTSICCPDLNVLLTENVTVLRPKERL